MNNTARPATKWHKYLSRIFLFLILFIFTGCMEESCGDSDTSWCNKQMTAIQDFTLTESQSTWSMNEDEVCVFGHYNYKVMYQYTDFTDADAASTGQNGDGTGSKNAGPKNKPNVTVKITAEGHGVLSGSSKVPPVYDSGSQMWVVQEEMALPRPKDTRDYGKAKPLNMTISVTLKKPLIKLGSKSPTISLPLIGPVIGPPPKDVFCSVTVLYDTPKTK